MDKLNRVAIDDCLPPDTDPALTGDVRNLPAIRNIGVVLDQLVNRANDDICRWGEIDSATANGGDLESAEKQLKVLETALAAGTAMVAKVKAQLPAPKAKAPAPKPAKAEAAPAAEKAPPAEPAKS